MNPIFPAVMQAIMKSSMNLMLGVPHVSKKHATSINGRAFAPNHGHQQEESGAVKEAKVRAHLNQLTREVKARTKNEEDKS